MKTTIYYFSGTGNCLKVARDLAAGLQDTKLVQICRDTVNTCVQDDSETIGFVYPVYFSGLPCMVKEFIEKLKINQDSYVFDVSTYGGSEGIAHKQVDNIMRDKGNRLSACFGIAMPGNYQILYAPRPTEAQEKNFKNQKDTVKKIIESIRDKKQVGLNGSGKGLAGAIMGLLYKSFKPLKKDKNFWTDEKCNGCGSCSKICPAGNVKMSGKKPEWQGKCEQCMACMQWCPKQSIQYKRKTLKWGRYRHPDVNIKELLKDSKI